MLALVVTAPDEDSPDAAAAPALRAALTSGLIARNYAVLAPGEPPGPEAGTFRVELSESGARARFAAPDDTVIYRAEVGDPSPDAPALARRLLARLPAK
jgi:hypothetical protein